MRRRALVIGGTGSIGSEIALSLAATADLILVYRKNQVAADDTLARIQTAYPQASVTAFAHPLSDQESVHHLQALVQSKWPNGPEILVCCFGDVDNALLMTEEPSASTKILTEHLLLKLQLCHSFVDSMYRSRFGRIVCIGSISSQYVKRGQVAYSAAAAGLEGMTKALALEVAGRGITVNLIRAGLVSGASLSAHQQVLAQSGRDLKKLIPVGRLGEASDIARTTTFLCADDADFITGTIVTVDGGRSLGDSHL